LVERVHPDLLFRCRGACGGVFYFEELLERRCRSCNNEIRLLDDRLEGLLANAGLIAQPKRRTITANDSPTLL
jgi:hypothetical protein